MEAKVIIITVVKSNKSENNVWMVAITGEEQGQAYCKSAYKAMRFAFKLKKQTGFRIEDASLKSLSEEIAQLKAAAAEVEAEKPVEQPAEQEPQVEAKPKKQRKPRSKKAEPVIVPISNEAQSELIAFQ